jgi:MFS family permease
VWLRPAENVLSFGSAWCQGFLEGGMVAFLAIYLLCMGLSETRVGWLTSGAMLGAILFQVPVAWVADNIGRARALMACYLTTALGLGLLPFCTATSWLALWLFMVGACSAAFYPLGLALLGERIPAGGLARANAWYLAVNCVGSLTGPAVCGVAMDRLGKPAVFFAGEAALLLVLTLVGARRVLHVMKPRRFPAVSEGAAGIEARPAA